MKPFLPVSWIEKTCQWILYVCLLLFMPTIVLAQLSGSYTLGAGGDFPTCGAAVNALMSQGVSGPVEINFLPGSYSDHLSLSRVPGSSMQNSVTFQSQNGDPSTTILSYQASSVDSNYVIKLDGVQHMVIRNLTLKALGTTYSRVIHLQATAGQLDSVQIINNVLYGYFDTNALANSAILFADDPELKDVYIIGNTFYNGSYAIHLQGWNNSFISGTHIISNTFINSGYASVFTHWNYAPVIQNNNIESGAYGIRAPSGIGAIKIEENRIRAGHWGIDVGHYLAYPNDRSRISNNMVSAELKEGISIGNSDFIDVYYNSVNVINSNTGSKAFQLNSVSAVPVVRILNNNFAVMDDGFAYHIYRGSAVELSDNNNLYSAGNYLAYRDSNIVDLQELQAVSGMDFNSLSVYPQYHSDSDLHTVAPWLDGRAVPIAEMIFDIDGEFRNAQTPDIGADEFTPDPATTTPLAGSMTVGDGGDYGDIPAAMADALLKGVSAPLTLDLLPGTYDQQVEILAIPGADGQNEVTLQSQSGSPGDVHIRYAASTLDSNYVIRLKGADHVRLRNMTITASGDPYARVVDLYLGADSVEISGNVLTSTYDNGNDPRQAVIGSEDSYYRSRLISGNRINRGTFGLFMRRGQNNYEHARHPQIFDNIIRENGYTGIYLQFTDAPEIRRNTIEAASAGIKLYSSDDQPILAKNKLDIDGPDGILISGSSSLPGHPAVLVNNFVHVGGSGGSGGANGIRLTNVVSIHLYYNSVHINSTNPTNGRAFWLDTGGSSLGITLYNNIFANSGGGYAYYVEQTGAIGISDNNDLYTAGALLAHWLGGRATLADLQAASGLEANSVSADPLFASNSDLHANAAAVDSAAYPLGNSDDIDGDIRDAGFPDIGADEFIFGYNYAPQIHSQPDTVAWVDSLYQYQVIASDNNGDDLRYILSMGPPWMSIDAQSGLLQGTPAQGHIGSSPVILYVDDGNGGSASQNFTLTVSPVVGIAAGDDAVPATCQLLANYPNPFNPVTTIRFSLPNTTLVHLEIFDMLGRRIVGAYGDTPLHAGWHSFTWEGTTDNGQAVASGVYFYRLMAGDPSTGSGQSFVQTRKMLLLR